MLKFFQQKKRYVFSSFCFVLGLYLLLSFLSFSGKDPSVYISVYPADPFYHNLGGALGAELSAHGYFQLGLACLGIPLLFLLLSYSMIKSEKLLLDFARILVSAACLFIVGIYLVQALHIPFSISGLELSPGGWLGEAVSSMMEKTFGKSLLLILVLGGVGPYLMQSERVREFFKNSQFGFFFKAFAQRFRKSEQAFGSSDISFESPSLSRIPFISGVIQWILGTKLATRYLTKVFKTHKKQSSQASSLGKEKISNASFVDQMLISDQQMGLLQDSIQPSGSNVAVPKNEFGTIQDTSYQDEILPIASSESIVHGDENSLADNQVLIADKAYVFPDLSAFKRPSLMQTPSLSPSELKKIDDLLLKTLSDFGIKAEIIGHQTGPVVTVFEVRPEAGVKQARLLGLSDDLALSLKSDSLLIQPIPEKSALGIQVPNSVRADVLMGELLDHSTFARLSSPLSFVIGKSISGQPVYADLGAMPHLLVAGSTGSGKSVGINTLITSMLARSTPKDVRMILVDPKMLELSVYEGIPHLLMPVITQPEKATSALRWAVSEMERRYRIMQQMQVRNISAFNQAWLEASASQRETVRLKVADETVDTLPYIMLVIDELADLMMTAPKEIESIIQRLAQKARASGIHMVLATQRPSVDIITGVIKANLPSRIAFQVVSKHDSRTILDQMGAEKLLGKGDLLLQRPGLNKLERIQGAYISDAEVVALVKSIKDKNPSQYDQNLIDWVERESSQDDGSDFQMEISSDDARWDDALEIAKSQGQVSASFLQRQLKIGYNRAARIVEQMERMGLVGKADGAKPRRWLGQTGEQKLF